MVGKPIAREAYRGNLDPRMFAPARTLTIRLRRLWLAAVFAGALVSCGSRTGLFGTDDAGSSGTVPGGDGSVVPIDGSVVGDGSFADVPGLDVVAKPDVDRRDCPDASDTYVYVVSSENELYSFYPPDLELRLVGNLTCPSAPGASPFSMAVDRKGAAFVLFTDGSLFRVSTLTAACIATAFKPNQLGFETFGMGFASDNLGAAETLYISDNDFDDNLRGLGKIDTTSFGVSFIGPFNPPIRRSELTGTGDGRLFAFSPITGGSRLAEIEKTTGKVLGQNVFAAGGTNDAFAFAFWGGDFWIFTSDGGGSNVTRYRPSTNSAQVVTTHPSTIVGAGVSTCAPQE